MKTLKHIIYPAAVFMLLASIAVAVPVIEEGFFLDGVTGIVRKVDNVDVWKFIPNTDVVGLKHTWPAGNPITLLPCSVLEQMTGLAGEDHRLTVRLWGLFTEYDENNYLYSVYFLPVGQTAEMETDSGKSASQDGQPDEKQDEHTENTAPTEPEQESIIPADILKQIKSAQAPDLRKFQQVAVVTGDKNLIGRAGYLQQKGKVRFFQPDGFGLNVNRHQYLLLPCSAGQEAEKLMQKSPGRERFNVSGLVTHYKGRNYILLRRAVRTYTHGNFTP